MRVPRQPNRDTSSPKERTRLADLALSHARFCPSAGHYPFREGSVSERVVSVIRNLRTLMTA